MSTQEPAHADSLEERVSRLEDAEAIRELKLTYARICDTGYDPEAIVALFDRDGEVSWESNVFGHHAGHAAIKGFFESVRHEILWAVHLMLNPLVRVAPDGLSAQGTWYLLQLATMVARQPEADADAVIMTGFYEDQFVKRDGGWRFQRIHIDFQQVSNLDRGWVAQQFR